MAASKTSVFIVFVLYLSCTLLVSLSGTQARRSCRVAADCLVLCRRQIEGCVDGKCVCEWGKPPETELTKTIRCKKDSECPDSRECPKDYYYSCLHGECTCIAV
ncbi:unnamed protein product [Thlaspi arvense]|uniref:Uncharacterized protein n=1 Tax=Thlaspi arvense TaxID=13288 RepID=A0AAU9SCW4_THLAR|nr:unnamed protein product [Thlaspi arvense]